MKTSDLTSVVNLYRDANRFASARDIRQWTKKGLTQYPDLNFVFTKKSEILGAISAIENNKRTAEINDVAVSPKYRNKKIGTRLMQKLLSTLASKKIRKIGLWVHWQNAAAIPFYFRFGFTLSRVMKTKDVEGVPNGEEIIVLKKSFT